MSAVFSRRLVLPFIIVLCSLQPCLSQTGLHPGFDHKEYEGLLGIADGWQYGSKAQLGAQLRKPFRLIYRSPEVGLFNQWSLWMRMDSVAVICIRGTIGKPESWLENFYAAMVPATGSLQLNDSTIFGYKLAERKDAAVHAGWLLGLAALAPTILHAIDSCYATGIKEYIIMGHSQGGAIAYLLRSYLQYLPDSMLPKDIVYKTYCSAAPKSGNEYYADDFDFITRDGWGLHVVNPLDWVPQTPFTVQTISDFNPANPFLHIKPALRRQKWLVRLYLGTVYRKLDRSTKKADRRLRKYLGGTVYKMVHKTLPQFRQPAYAQTTNYMPAGYPVVLLPYPGYEEEHKFNGKNVFVYHGLDAYYDLVKHYYAGE